MKLHFDGKTADIKVVKDGRVWMYFTMVGGLIKYRVNKTTGEVQVGPYWKKLDMYVD